MQIRGSVAVVTGASAGIGWSTAFALAREGATVVVSARRIDRLEQLVDVIRERGGRALAVPCDVSEWAQVEALAEAVEAAYGRCDILVNNAGIPGGGPFAELSLKQIERVVRTNYLGVLYGTKAFLPMMLAAGKGHIVNMASLAGRFAVPGSSVYSSTKHAVVAFSESLHYEVEPKGILVTAVNPGLVNTEAFPHTNSRERLLGVMKPERVADVIVEVVREGIAPERSIPRFLAALQLFRVLTPPFYRFGLRLATRGAFRPTRATGRGLHREPEPVSTTDMVTMKGEDVKTVYALVQNPAAGEDILPEDEGGSRVVYRAFTSGQYLLFLKAEVETYADLPELVRRILGKGNWGIQTLIPVAFGVSAPKVRGLNPADYEAVVLVKVQPGRAVQVLNAIKDKPSVNGSAVVTGPYDLIVIVRGADAQEIAESVQRDIGGVAGVLSTETCFILDEEYYD